MSWIKSRARVDKLTLIFLCVDFQYPEAIKRLEYMPGFAIRGLHYDIEKGLLLKLDSFLQIQLGSVYRGLTPVSDAEVLRLYRSRTVPIGKCDAYLPSFLFSIIVHFLNC